MPELLLTVAGIAGVIGLTSATGSAISALMARCWPTGSSDAGAEPGR